MADTEWRLVALGDADAPAGVVVGDPTARFTTNTDMTGWTGCNSYGARYSVGRVVATASVSADYSTLTMTAVRQLHDAAAA